MTELDITQMVTMRFGIYIIDRTKEFLDTFA